MKDPDHWYEADNWEVTYPWAEMQDFIKDTHFDAGLAPHEPLEIGTLYEGPRRFAIALPTSIDEEGEADEWGPVTTWPSRERAIAAYDAALKDLRLEALG